jgi:Protein of unknown function (DUF2848)
MTEVRDRESGRRIELGSCRLLIAGFAGRDEADVRVHIRELAAIGVPVPGSFPTFYELDPLLLSTAARLPITAATTSGEVEPVLIRYGGCMRTTAGRPRRGR